MDYFKNLKNRITPQKTQPTHAEQLAKFRKSWKYIEAQFNNDDKKPPANHVLQTEIHLHLKTMVDLLADEGLMLEDVNTGLCMEEFLKNNVLKELEKLAKADIPKGIRGEIIRTVAQMINLLDDRFLVHNAVHQPTVQLLRTCVHDEGEKYDEDLVDLMYIICSKIHAFPALLHIFFHDTHWLTTPQKANIKKEAGQVSFSSNSSQDGNFDDGASISTNVTTSVTKTTEFTEEPEKPEYEFLLFTYLLQFLHREGKSGEYARYGLLFIIELAEGPLGDFILESDFATIMAAGLGALYSQLPRKLMVKSSSGGLTNATLLGFGDNTSAELDRLRSSGIEVSSSTDFKSQLDSFLKLLEFCQDVLNECPNQNISRELLTNVKTNFLENILYPSIMECSDSDGSAVAVISYIDIIMQTLDQEELVDVVVGFLMDSDGDDEEFWKQTAKKNKMLKRQSTINLFEGIENNPIKSSPYFTATGRFTLKDLIFSRLRSSSQQTVIATLKLLHTVISKHCRYSLKLLNIELDENATFGQQKLTTISHHLRELDLFFSLISAIDPTQNMEIFTNGYDSYVRDAEMIIEADRCYINGQDMEWTEEGPVRPKSNKSNKQRSTYSHGKGGKKCGSKGMSAVPKHRLNPTDRNPGDSLLQILLGTLSNFFAHSPELNLTLTGVLSALAVCPYRSLEGWLVFSGIDRLDNHRDYSTKGFENNHHDRNVELLSPGINNHEGHANSDSKEKAIDDFDEADDRSIDYDVDKSLSAVKAIGATPMWTNFPPFFTIFKTLTQQVDYYRSEIDGFDQYLEERRNGLLDADDGIDENFFKQPSYLPTRPPARRGSTAANHSSSPNPSTKTRRNTSHSPSSTHQAPRRANSLSPAESSSPMGSSAPLSSFSIVTPLSTHYKKTEDIKILPLFPTHFVNEEEEEDSIDYEITLSTLLNNVVILEEAVKELVALVQVRRSLGVDEVRYL
ncbi:4553_t:CDS:2 [Funneliformis geosporum]|uniref:10408_t:CDS:1 n=1 Tax=Funneliformis geosporum TaxID=1117311 RepID=A0A9W4SYW8_9GLOM|nr:10408_t:CDS:2 [Funneliformis geosporum]CAI2184170.1 4553_t:CDS:2 [Funneliformis geosporum]